MVFVGTAPGCLMESLYSGLGLDLGLGEGIRRAGTPSLQSSF